MQPLKAYRGSIFHLVDNPIQVQNQADAYQYWEDGILLVENGKIQARAPQQKFCQSCRRAWRWPHILTPSSCPD